MRRENCLLLVYSMRKRIKIRTANAWNYATYFSITATFDVEGSRLSNLRNARMNIKLTKPNDV